MDGDEDEETRRAAASLEQLKQMFRRSGAEGECHADRVDDEALDAELDDLKRNCAKSVDGSRYLVNCVPAGWFCDSISESRR